MLCRVGRGQGERRELFHPALGTWPRQVTGLPGLSLKTRMSHLWREKSSAAGECWQAPTLLCHRWKSYFHTWRTVRKETRLKRPVPTSTCPPSHALFQDIVGPQLHTVWEVTAPGYHPHPYRSYVTDAAAKADVYQPLISHDSESSQAPK